MRVWLVAGLVLGAYVAGRCTGTPRPDPELLHRADSLAAVAQQSDSLLAVLARRDSLRLAEARDRTAAHQIRAVALGDTATHLALLPAQPDSCAAHLQALRGVVLRFMPAVDSAFAAWTQERAVLGDVVGERDSIIGELQGQRDAALAVAREATRTAVRPSWWRRAVGVLPWVAGAYMVVRLAQKST